MLIEQLVELSKQDGMTLEKGARLIVKNLGIANKMEESQGANPIPYEFQHILQPHYSTMVEQINKIQQANLVELEKRLGDCIDQRNKLIEDDRKVLKEQEERIEKRLEQRYENIMKVIRDIQETKRTIVSAQEEMAAAMMKKKPWWKF
ncbi:hypothetical protein COM25_10195 [Bacillus wiedmannii]|uniref:DUF3967 domain-containing protein n=2 Tax=Bacillus wiedmannii TaxID=1890302 RepID=A0ABD6TND2_9BACI|nr:hypothetical protein CN560_12370 [Bacillus wiedmannii]PEP14062.1 hypothetical protein CN552_16100 [Bacillus wiedmannii]PFX61701.1 hypothetical protein COL36_10625 [Bacillus wiedmannii]PGC76040.1 hypothetical protein COM25_10195 [Bacillus wiedmannii]PHB04977.1 hypothetical protein COE81_19855 [Bacillus wiedmannii]